MLKVGYYRLEPGQAGAYETALRSLGCQVVRSEARSGASPTTLHGVLDFIGPGDQLVVPSLEHLGGSNQSVLDLLARLDQMGASLLIAEPPMVSTGVEGRALRAALSAAAILEPAQAPDARRSLRDGIRRLHSQGVSQTKIAQRLSVSRMTVWRHLKDAAAGD
jgi:DNA invertase Pin-like site-specific DNA recombinase